MSRSGDRGMRVNPAPFIIQLDGLTRPESPVNTVTSLVELQASLLLFVLQLDDTTRLELPVNTVTSLVEVQPSLLLLRPPA